MRKSGLVFTMLAVTLAACGRGKESGQLAALEEAYKSGVLTKAEYDAKRAALQSPSQLTALDEAYRSGVLTKAEYDAKRAALNGQKAAVPAPATAAAPVSAVAAPAPFAAPPASAVAAPAPVAAPPSSVAAVSAEPAPLAPAPVAPTHVVPAPAAPTATRGNYLVLRKIQIMDQYGYERPIPSASMLMPADWQYQGATRWNQRDKCSPTSTSLRATGPDGRGFEAFPAYYWTWADDPRTLQLTYQQTAQSGWHACDVMPLMSAGDYLRRNLPRVRPGAQLVGMEPLPKVIQAMQQQGQQTEQMARQYGLTQRVRPDAVRARIRYSQNGQAVEEWIYVTVSVTANLAPSMNMQTYQMTQSFSYICTAVMFAERAPQGQLESSEKFFNMMVNSVRINPQWLARLTNTNKAMFDVEHAEIAKRSAITTKLGNDMNEIRRQGWDNQQRSEEHVFGQFSQATLGIETYRNPVSGETWDISNQFNHAWINNRNEIVVSDQEGWDPSVALKGDWTALQPVRQ